MSYPSLMVLQTQNAFPAPALLFRTCLQRATQTCLLAPSNCKATPVTITDSCSGLFCAFGLSPFSCRGCEKDHCYAQSYHTVSDFLDSFRQALAVDGTVIVSLRALPELAPGGRRQVPVGINSHTCRGRRQAGQIIGDTSSPPDSCEPTYMTRGANLRTALRKQVVVAHFRKLHEESTCNVAGHMHPPRKRRATHY